MKRTVILTSPIKQASLTKESFSVDGKEIMRIYATSNTLQGEAVKLWRKQGAEVTEATWFVAYGIKSVQDWLFEQYIKE